jgi:serpin B
VKVDEGGTVAAAATVGVTITAVPATQFTMVLDHPFFFAIRDNATGTLLFVGAVLDPSR